LFWNPTLIPLLFLGTPVLLLRKDLTFIATGILMVLLVQTYIVSSWWVPGFGGGFGHRAFVDFLPLVAFCGVASFSILTKRRMIFHTLLIISIFGTYYSLWYMMCYWKGKLPFENISSAIWAENLPWPLSVSSKISNQTERYNLDDKIRIYAKIKELRGLPNQQMVLTVKIENPHANDIPCRALNFHPSYRLFCPTCNDLVHNYEAPRSPIEVLTASSMTPHELYVTFPKEPGEYEMRLYFVHEHVAWMSDSKHTAQVLRMIVKEP
jgi:hypothetical protein